MSRLEKKCFVGSAAFHGLLFVVLICGAAFRPSKKTEELPAIITLIGAQVTDRPIASGGNPNVAPTPAPPPQAPAQPPETVPPRPEPPPPQREAKPEPKVEAKTVVKNKPKPEPKKELVENKDGDLPAPKNTKKDVTPPKPLLSKTIIRRTNDTARIQRETAERQAREREQEQYRRELARIGEQQRRIASEVGSIIGGVSKSIGKATVVEAAGPGGAAYVNYGSLVGEVYKRAVYATHPQSDQDAEAAIRILVTRDGTVRSSQWVRRTGSPVLDKAVDRAMNSVRSLPGFPPEAKDSERTFNITIAFEAKRVSA